MNSWIEVRPAGYLKKFGNHKFYVASPAEAIKAMMFQVKGFKEAFHNSQKKGLKFAVITDKRNIRDAEELLMGKPKVVSIVPKYEGAKNRAGTFLLAAVAIAAVVFSAGTAGFGAGAWFAAGSTSAAVGTNLAVALALGGITQLLTPQPKGLNTTSDAANKPSYAFGGPVNTTAQGQPVPVLYGQREVGGAIASASILAEDQQ